MARYGAYNDWHLHFSSFRDWLGKDDSGIKISTANNIIRILNTFITYLSEYNLIDPDNTKKCPAYPEHLIGRRGFEHVISEEEMRHVYRKMSALNQPSAEFFLTLWSTGMRFSELFGLPMTALFKGEIPNQALHDELVKCGVSYVGYIYLDSQPQTDSCKRLEDKSLPRKPLKGFREIGPKYARIIPIRTRELWNILASRHKQQSQEFLKKRYTGSKQDYMLFDDLEWNRANNSIREAYKALHMEPKSYHCCRHSFATSLVGETRSFFLVRAITGHRKDKSFERYLHIYEQIALNARQDEQIIDVI